MYHHSFNAMPTLPVWFSVLFLQLTWTSKAFYKHAGEPVKWEGGMPADIVSYLPLSHIAGQMADIYIPLISGTTVSFAAPDALKGSIRTTLMESRPTVFFGVPR